MVYYKSADQIYTILRALFESLRDENPNPVDTLVATRLNIRISLTDPEAQITIKARQPPVEVIYGEADGRADLEIGMTADQMHLILLDEYSIKTGFTNGELKVRGQVWKALSLADIFIKGRTYYPKVLQDHGMG